MLRSDLRRGFLRRSIIAALLGLTLALSACGLAVRIGYNQASPIAFRWLDSYVDFDDAQSLRVRGALDDWFAWHRRTQLPDYADLLARVQTELAAPATPERACSLWREIRVRLDTGLEHAGPALAEVVPTLSVQQIANIEKRYAEKNREYREDFLHPEPAKRRRAAVRREIERAELLYGSLDDAQREFVARSVAQSPWDGDLAYAERLRRQQDVLAMLRRLAAQRASRAEADAEMRAYVQRLDRSPNEVYRRYAERLAEHQCSFAAALHNLTSAEQRRVAVRRLKDYEGDFRALAADGA
ncbi:MAG: DUF6279 family lipoprotein [Caldimonas sp.]